MDLSNIEQENEKLLIASKLINAKNFAKAKTILEEYIMKVTPLIKQDSKEEDLCFSNVGEFYVYIQKFKPKKNIIWVNCKLDIAYQWLAYIANEEQKFKEALDYIKKGLIYNPMNTDLYYEKIETYKFQKDWDNLYKVTDEVYPLILTSRDLAKYYRALGYYFIEKGIFEVAYALYMFSLEYDESIVAKKEINYIRETINNPQFNMTLPDAITIFLKNNINVGAPKENVQFLKKLLNEESLIKNDEETKFDIEENLFRLTNDDTYFHSLFLDLDIGKEEISEEATLRLLNKDKFMKNMLSNDYQLEYIIDTKENSYKGFIHIADDDIQEEGLDKDCPYKIELVGIFSSDNREHSFIEFKIANREE